MATTKNHGDRGTLTPAGLYEQRTYTKRLAESGFEFSLVVAEAFIRGIRDIGYKHTGTALDELFDNSAQAGAQNIHITLGFDAKSDAKPSAMAVIDDGHGMDPAMIRAAVMWGGTHRENDRKGFGRYGYGLPSACVSQGKSFTVFSRPEGGQFHKVTVDIDAIGEGKYNGSHGRIEIPTAQLAEPPNWVTDYIKKNMPDGTLAHGTIVVIEKLDRLSWKTATNLTRNLLEHFGIVYRNYLRQLNIVVNGTRVEPVDPLFITPGARFYDLDDDRAEPREPAVLEVKDADTGKPLGVITVRYSYMPPTFARTPDDKQGRGKNNARLGIMKDHNGIIVMRQGRQLDVVTRCPWTVFRNNDRYWGVEIDFSATLDEEFSVTTSKQQVVLSDRMWALLKEAGVYKVIESLRKQYEEDRKKLSTAHEAAKKRASEKAMEDAQKFKVRKPAGEPTERARREQEALEKAAQKRARETNRPFEVVEQEIIAEQQGHPYKVDQESIPGGPFYRVEKPGGQTVLRLNTAHRFFTDVYAGPESTPRLRAALEALLFVMGECELDSSNDRRVFYETERGEWSRVLSVVLDRLSHIEEMPEEVLDGDDSGPDTAPTPEQASVS